MSPYAEGIFKLHITVPDRWWRTNNTVNNVYDSAYGAATITVICTSRSKGVHKVTISDGEVRVCTK